MVVVGPVAAACFEGNPIRLSLACTQPGVGQGEPTYPAPAGALVTLLVTKVQDAAWLCTGWTPLKSTLSEPTVSLSLSLSLLLPGLRGELSPPGARARP